MKKIVALSILLAIVILAPQTAFAQTEVAPVKQEVKAVKQEGAQKEMKEKALPVKTERASGTTVTVEDKNKPTETSPEAKNGEQQEMKNNAVPAKPKPRKAVITPLKNPKNNKVTLGKKIDKKEKVKDKKLRTEEKMY